MSTRAPPSTMSRRIATDVQVRSDPPHVHQRSGVHERGHPAESLAGGCQPCRSQYTSFSPSPAAKNRADGSRFPADVTVGLERCRLEPSAHPLGPTVRRPHEQPGIVGADGRGADEDRVTTRPGRRRRGRGRRRSTGRDARPRRSRGSRRGSRAAQQGVRPISTDAAPTGAGDVSTSGGSGRLDRTASAALRRRDATTSTNAPGSVATSAITP